MMSDYGKARFDTTIIKDDDEKMPSVRSIVIATQAMGLGAMTIDDFSFVRLPHPAPVVLLVLELASEIDAVQAELPEMIKKSAENESYMAPVTSADFDDQGIDGESIDISLHTHDNPPGVHLMFPEPVDSIHLTIDEAMEFAESVRTAATKLIAAAEGGSSGGSATEA